MILIVGEAGYIGSHVNKLLNQEGFGTVVFDNLSRGYREFVKWGEFVEGDLLDVNQIQSCFENFRIEAVMHFSAFALMGRSVAHSQRYYKNNAICRTTDAPSNISGKVTL